MGTEPAVSVVIPHLNEPADLRRCLKALVGQRETDFPVEIIVVDNGSASLPADVCAEFEAVRLEVELEPGPGPARNRGAAVARAAVIAFIDADCIASPGWARALVAALQDRPDVSFVGGDIRVLVGCAERLTSEEAYESVFSYRNQVYVERHGFSATGNMAVRAEVFRRVGPFGGIGSMEDTEWGRRATALGHRCAFVGDAIVHTPPCRSFAELARRWDRHVAHEFGQVGSHPSALLVWAVRSAAVAGSPVLETITVARSDRIAGLRNRLLALACMTRVRLYRARKMLALLVRDNTATTVHAWNRENC